MEHWLSQLTPEGPEPAQLLAQGFSADGQFSNDGKRLLLSGDTLYDAPAHDAELRLYDLADPAQPHERLLSLGVVWAEPTFSSDSTYLAMITYSLTRSVRELWVVDLLAPDVAPRAVYSCSSNPAPLPGCPNFVVF